jgi:hypothetical protein
VRAKQTYLNLAMPKLTVYYSSATGDLAIKKNQQHLHFLLDGNLAKIKTIFTDIRKESPF